jgi:endonuclease/exonuclease/phosphatase family metal-dependent hydrolase
MSSIRVLMSNIAYARGMSGSLFDQVLRAYRHVHCRRAVQLNVVQQIRGVVEAARPDVIGFVEIERGRASGRAFHQLHAILDGKYPVWDIANKYFKGPRGHGIPFLGRNCNAFCAKRPIPFERVYLPMGMKRLAYQIALTPRLTLFFTHLALRFKVRVRQIEWLRGLIDATPGDHVVMGDFNVFTGLDELKPLVDGSKLVLMNDPFAPTHRFHKRHRVLDLCLVSERLRRRAELEVIPQGYSDHAALLLRIKGIRMHAPDEAVLRAQGIVRRHVGEGRALSEELLSDRRKEAKRE